VEASDGKRVGHKTNMGKEYARVHFDNHAREALMDIIDDRHIQSTTIVPSQIPVSAWYDIIGEGTIADEILDRFVNSSHRIDLKGESLRKGILKNE